jgi:hypothetical protein
VISTVHRTLWLVFFCVLCLAPRARASEPAIAADLDGDGHRDRITIQREEPFALRIWLSTVGTTEVVRSREPILHVAAADLDGDRRLEVIASSGSLRLKIWTKKGDRFRTYSPERVSRPEIIGRPTGHAQEPESADELSATFDFRVDPAAFSSMARPRAPTRLCSRSCRYSAQPPYALRAFIRLAPRPPPLSAL